MCEQNASYLVKHSDLGAKNLNKICLKIGQKVLKWPLQYVNFQKCFGAACPRTLLEPFLFSIYFKIIRPENSTPENMAKFGALSLKKILEYVADMKTFFKGLFTPFLGLTSLCLVHSQTNSKFQLPLQNFPDSLLNAGSSFF